MSDSVPPAGSGPAAPAGQGSAPPAGKASAPPAGQGSGPPAAAAAEVTLYGKPGCHLCEHALEGLRRLQAELDFRIAERDISGDERLLRAYFDRIPVIALDGVELCEYHLDEDAVRETLRVRAGAAPSPRGDAIL